MGVECVTGRWRQKGEDSSGSGAGSGSGGDGLSDPSKELLMSTGRLNSFSEEELPVLLSRSFSLLFVLSSALRRASFWNDPGVDWLAGREVPRLSVVGVVRFWRPPAAHCSMQTMSSRIGSARVGSANPIGVASFGQVVSRCAASGRVASSCTAGVVVASIASRASSGRRGYCAGAGRSARICCSNFSILVL